ncbi:MAG: sortase, partial [Oscillospiraceae bacterium]|nr:sortase [Oscillospiraceae bacterium]
IFDEYISRDDPTYYEQPQEEVININGDFYSGIVEIPVLSLELPVYRDLDYENLKYSPCRYKGSVQDGNIIIAAHNYSSHFGNIDNMISGDRIYFTDAQGIVYEYEVITTEVVDGTDIEAMESGSEEWDMTIFTCTLSGMSRIAVRAAAV